MLMAPRGYPLAPSARLRAPEQSGEVLVAPSWDRAGDLISANAAARQAWDEDVHGIALAELAFAARRQILDAAAEYTRTYAARWTDGTTTAVTTRAKAAATSVWSRR